MDNSKIETSDLLFRRIGVSLQKEATKISRSNLELASLPHDVTLDLLRFYIVDNVRLLGEIAERELELKKMRALSLMSDKKSYRHKIDFDPSPLISPLRRSFDLFRSIRKLVALTQFRM